MLLPQRSQCLLRTAYASRTSPSTLENPANQIPTIRLVVDDQDAGAVQARQLRFIQWLGGERPLVVTRIFAPDVRHRERHDEGAALVLSRTLHSYRSAVQLHQSPHD